MDLSTLKPPIGAVKKRKRIGRGDASGHGSTSGHGNKGQKARAGSGTKPYFEGGQMPLARRLPKRGFRNPFRRAFAVINVAVLNKLPAGTIVDESYLRECGFIKKDLVVKILGKGSIDHPVTVRRCTMSRCARQKILSVGGSIIEEK